MRPQQCTTLPPLHTANPSIVRETPDGKVLWCMCVFSVRVSLDRFSIAFLEARLWTERTIWFGGCTLCSDGVGSLTEQVEQGTVVAYTREITHSHSNAWVPLLLAIADPCRR